MKKNIIHAILVIGVVTLLVNCSDDSDKTDKEMKYFATAPGGCNNQDFSDLKSTFEDYADTMIFTIVNDTLDIFIGINYICCAPFSSETEIVNDSILITISDDCPAPYQDCYCRCMCYYTWDFSFVDFEEKEYHFKVILNDPRVENPIVFRKGTLQISGINR